MVVEKFNPHGLTSDEAALRLKKYGPNELKKQRTFSSLKILFNQFTSPLIYILVFAGLVTFFLRDFTDTIVIFAAVVLNTALGFYQEQKSQKSMMALRSLITPMAKVIRDGEQKIIDARNLVPGDLVVLTIGVKIPADGILIKSKDLTVDEAILTGESMPVVKKSGSFLGISESAADKQPQMVFMGTTVVIGIAKMIVTKTGMETKIGQIGRSLIEIKEERTPLQIEISKLAKILALVVGVITLFIFFFGRFLGYQFLEMFTTSVAVAVAAIPEGLPISFTIILALGMQRILKRKAVVRKLLATETLGSVSTICIDKTGTLTEGKMKVVEALPFGEMLTKAALLCNDSRDPLELAMEKWAKEKGQNKNKLLKAYPRLDEIPFNPKDKFIVSFHEDRSGKGLKGEKILFLSGAPEIVLEKSQFKKQKEKDNWLKKFNQLGDQGYRLVGFAYKKIKTDQIKIQNSYLKDFEWLGILVYDDSIRLGVKEALRECQQAGVEVKVITGDYPNTARAVMKKLAIEVKESEFLTGKELEDFTEEELNQKVKTIKLFARTTPEQKLKIVKALKYNHEVVAMMGDGVNDALALKQADVGIVVSQASDVAKETADMVLLDSDFATIVHAIEEGRNIFENIRKVVLYLLSSSFTEIILIGGSILLGLPLPLAAVQILWINLIEDAFPAIGLAFEPWEKELMMIPPRRKATAILSLPMKFLIFVVGIFLNFFLLFLFWALNNKNLFHLSSPQTVMFVALGINFLFVPFACRSLRKPIFKFNPFGNKILDLTLIIGFVLLVSAVYLPPLQLILKTRPLGTTEWIFLLFFGFFSFLLIELTKWAFILKKRNL